MRRHHSDEQNGNEVTVSMPADVFKKFNEAGLPYKWAARPKVKLIATWKGLFELAEGCSKKSKMIRYINSDSFEKVIDSLTRLHDEFDDAVNEVIDRQGDIVKIITMLSGDSREPEMSMSKSSPAFRNGRTRGDRYQIVIQMPYYQAMNISEETYYRLEKYITDSAFCSEE